MPPISPAVLLVIQAIQAAIAAAPGLIDIANKGKDLIASLFTAKLINKAQQDACFAFVDAHYAMVLAGVVPLSWQVEPDPTD